MSELRFMSQEHVDVMNALLIDNEAVKEACRGLGVPRALSYDLTDGPGGSLVHWGVLLGNTLQFSLERPENPDVVLAADWSAMILATQAGRNGEVLDAGVTVTGDAALLARIDAVLEVARPIGAVPVVFPDV